MIENPFVSLRWMLDGLTVDGVETRGAEGDTEPRGGASHLHGKEAPGLHMMKIGAAGSCRECSPTSLC